MTEAEVIQLMASSTVANWNQNAEKVRAAYDGKMPDYWGAKVLQSGLCKSIMGEEFCTFHLNIGHRKLEARGQKERFWEKPL